MTDGARVRRIARTVFGLVLAPVVALVVWAASMPLPKELVREKAGARPSLRVRDSEGAVLRDVRADDGARARPVTLDDVPDDFVAALLAAEDARFFRHPGVDPVALVRATVANLAARRVVSGASTLTMQLARVVRPHPKTLLGKLSEMALALRIEASFDKRTILEAYVNEVPFGPQIRGVEAASRHYFGKSAKDLSLAESAALAALPRGPSYYDIARHELRARRRRDHVLVVLRNAEAGSSRDRFETALAEPLRRHGEGASFGAPHFVVAVTSGAVAPNVDMTVDGVTDVTTTLRSGLQRDAEILASRATRSLAGRGGSAASVVVVDNASGDVLAYVGSDDYFDRKSLGSNDGVRARRQPGSTLKPFVYALAMERLGFDSTTLLPDLELEVEGRDATFSPKNYDGTFHGPVRLRDALANSYNVPAVWTASRLGEGPLLEGLRRFGFTSLDADPAHYGVAVALGSGEVTLLELVHAYATLARRGESLPLRFVSRMTHADGRVVDVAPGAPTRVLRADLAASLADVLSDARARRSAFGDGNALELPFPVSVKTGTSKGYRDNWTVGFTDDVTVGVWVGHFDGHGMEGVSGVSGAAPLFRDVMVSAVRHLDAERVAKAPEASGHPYPRRDDLVVRKICPLSGGLATDACPHAVDERMPPATVSKPCRMHEHVAIDRRNGLRAGVGCDPTFVERRTFEWYPDTFAPWARATRRSLAPTDVSPLCPSGPVVRATFASEAGPVRITSPKEGARFVVDPERPLSGQRVVVRAVSGPGGHGASGLRLMVDGRSIHGKDVVSDDTVEFDWPLARGAHVLEVVAAGSRDRVHVVVD
ncbi:MAG: penicillin-binding protein 1C [Polyangiaceae bacterium]